MRRATAALLALLLAAPALAQERTQQQPGREYPPKLASAVEAVYKTIGDVKLKLFVFNPSGHKSEDKTPAIVFFFGGGWQNGSPAQFQHQCRYLASRGMVAIAADYRVGSRHKVKAVDCVRDAKSAVRYLRASAARLGIDPERIAAGGGSAGAHIAACTGLVEGLDEPGEEAKISSRPNALVLFNPPAALAPFEGLAAADESRLKQLEERLGVEPKAISPAHHVKSGSPPTIQFFGTADRLLSGGEYLHKQMKAAGNRSELETWKDQGHGFFNFGRGENKNFRETVEKMDRFLVSLGYLAGEPTVEKYLDSAR